MNNEQVLIFNNLLSEILADPTPVKTVEGKKALYAITRNADKLAGPVKAVKAVLDNDEGLKKYHEERIALCEKHAEKDENGMPKKIGQRYDLVRNMAAFEVDMKLLDVKHKESLDRERDFLAADAEKIDFHKIKIEYLPEHLGSGRVISGLKFIIEEE